MKRASLRFPILSAGILLAAIVSCQPSPPVGTANPDREGAAPAAAEPLTAHIWVRSDSTGLPGVMKIFLADGTLLMDSCWETYRLEHWTRGAGDEIAWEEDGRPIHATVAAVSADSLTLRLALSDGEVVERYHRAPVPFVCPELRR